MADKIKHLAGNSSLGAMYSPKKRRKSRQKILSRALKLLPHMPGLPCHALPALSCLACCHQRRIWVKNGRILEKNAKCLAKTSKKTRQLECAPSGAAAAAAGAQWGQERGHSFPCPNPLPMISCQLLTQPCNSFRQRLHYITQMTPPHTHTDTYTR